MEQTEIVGIVLIGGVALVLMFFMLASNDQQLLISTTVDSGVGENTVCGNVGTGVLVHVVGSNCNAKSLVGSSDISITNSSNTITIDFNGTSGSETTNCNNVGTGVLVHVVGSNCNARSFISGSAQTLVFTQNTNDITITDSWEKLCQTILGSPATSVSCTFSSRQHLYVSLDARITTATFQIAMRFNGDASTNYSDRSSVNGGAQVTQVSATNCRVVGTTLLANGERAGIFLYIFNSSLMRKIATGNYAGDTATSITVAPAYSEFSCKWGNTTSNVGTIQFFRLSGTGNLDTNTKLTVWGYN